MWTKFVRICKRISNLEDSEYYMRQDLRNLIKNNFKLQQQVDCLIKFLDVVLVTTPSITKFVSTEGLKCAPEKGE